MSIPPPIDPPPTADARPDPPRFRWLRRFLVLGVLLVIALVGLRVWWGHEAQRRINAIVAEAHSRGEPILPGEFASKAPPETRSEAAQLSRVLRWSKADHDFIDEFNFNTPPTEGDRAAIRAIMKSHAVLVAAVRAARGADAATYVPPPARNPLALHGSLTDLRRLANLLNLCAVEAHAAGDDTQTLEYLRDLGTLANVVRNGDADVISDLMGGGINSMEGASAIRTAATFHVRNDGTLPAATRAQAHALIEDLLNERHFVKPAVRKWEYSRSCALFAAEDPSGMEFQPGALALLSRPIFQLADVRNARTLGAAVDAARQTQYPAALQRLGTTHTNAPESILERISTGAPNWFDSPPHNAFKFVFRSLLTRRAAAISLAIQLYAGDHHGRWPETLAELVPRYLPSAPIDPFAADGRALRYLPHRNPPVVYSVGENGTDDGGLATFPPSNRFPSPSYGGADSVFPLGWPNGAPTTAPATKPTTKPTPGARRNPFLPHAH